MNRTVLAALVGGTLALANSASAQDASRERVVVTHETAAPPRIVTQVPDPAATNNSGWIRAISGGASGGGVGGAIGGYYINGTTPMDNRRLSGGAMPSR
jgi:hypothetical protein